ncbi:hypothetical protein ACVWZZ_004369 [Bradyrhizobium sp. LM6.10]
MRKGLFWLNDKQWVQRKPHLPTNLSIGVRLGPLSALRSESARDGFLCPLIDGRSERLRWAR